MSKPVSEGVAYLRSPDTIRSHCKQIFDLAKEDKLLYFTYQPKQIKSLTNYVLDEIHSNYPQGNIPYHSRFRHFEVGGIDRINILKERLDASSNKDLGRALFELVFVSVLLDAGAGKTWKYKEDESWFSRSEGLGVASFHMFCAGLFSSDKNNPLSVDSKGLSSLSQKMLEEGFQIDSENSMVGLEGRLSLLKSLGESLKGVSSSLKSEDENPRLSILFDSLWQKAMDQNKRLSAKDIFSSLLEHFSSIWPQSCVFEGVKLGDVGKHSLVKGEHNTDGLVPFHKLSQWLSYSLLEPFEESGITIDDVNELTGLPEYRNGGLLLDLGVLKPRSSDLLLKAHKPVSEVVVEWRALTISILDLLSENIRSELKVSDRELPLAKILQGGTWSAGRKIAKTLRTDGSPPLTLDSDGTVF